MTDSVEVAITSDTSGQLWTVSVWDISSGSQLMTYKNGGVCAANSLSLVGSDYLVGADMSKPLLYVWAINRSEPLTEYRTVSPGIVKALSVSPNGLYVVAGIAEKIYVWQLEAGRLMCVVARHFQPVTCIQFFEDGSHFVSAGEDGMVLVWSLSELVAQDSPRLDAVRSFQDHYLAVTGLFIGHGGARTRIVSVSLDSSCRVYDFLSGKLLLSVIVDGENLTSVTTDLLESSLFLGCNSGDILTVNLKDGPRPLELHLSEEEKKSVFKGHVKAVTALSPSQNATSLLSASADETVRIWHIESKQCLRIIQHKGPVNNAFITFLPSQMFAEKLKPSIVMHRLQRVNAVEGTMDFTFDIIRNFKKRFSPDLEKIYDCDVRGIPSVTGSSGASNEEIEELKRANLSLFKFASEKILQSTGDDVEVPDLVDIDLCVKTILNGSLKGDSKITRRMH